MKANEEPPADSPQDSPWVKKTWINPDELVISKEDILRITKLVKNRWRKNTKSNWRFIAGMIAFEGGLHLTDEDTISKIWTDLIKVTNELVVYNNMKHLAGEFPDTKAMLDIVEKKINSGELIG